MRFHIYELIAKNLLKEAKKLFFVYFSKLFEYNEFLDVKTHFFILLNNLSVSRSIIIKKFKHMRTILGKRVENYYKKLLRENDMMFIKKEEGFSLKNCCYLDIKGFYLMQCEIEISLNVLSEVRKIEYNRSSLVCFEMYCSSLQNKTSLFNLFDNISENVDNKSIIEEQLNIFENNTNDQITSSDNKSIISEELENDNEENYYDTVFKNIANSSNITANFNSVEEEIDIIGITNYSHKFPASSMFNILFIGRNIKNSITSKFNSGNPYTSYLLNFNSKIKSFDHEKSNKFFIKKNHDTFLKHFTPSFTKKENIDKIIIRRFAKFVAYYFNNNINYNRNDNNSNNTTNHENSEDFAFEFANAPYIPPFKYKNCICFKSFNVNYLNWLFNNKYIQYLYSIFADYYGSSIAEHIINKNNLYETEMNICNKIKYYIKHFNIIYSNIDSNTIILDKDNCTNNKTILSIEKECLTNCNNKALEFNYKTNEIEIEKLYSFRRINNYTSLKNIEDLRRNLDSNTTTVTSRIPSDTSLNKIYDIHNIESVMSSLKNQDYSIKNFKDDSSIISNNNSYYYNFKQLRDDNCDSNIDNNL